MPCLIIFTLLFFHECGHFFMAYLLHFDVDKIYFYPWGGISKFTTQLNVSIKKEFLVLISGPIFQIIIYIILKNTMFFLNYIPLLENINKSLLVFNLLPIYPLDGGKLVNILFNLFLSFKKSLVYTLYLSCVATILFFCVNIDDLGINLIFISFFLFFKILDEKKKIGFYMDKFLLERYLYDFKFKKRKNVSDISDFSRDRKHLVYKDDRYFSEKEILLKKFKK